MSIKVMTLVWDGFPAAGSELLAMLALADWCDDRGGSLYPSVKAVGEKVRVQENHARKILRKFETDRFLAVVGNHNGGKPGTTREYRLNVGKLKLLADEANAKKEAEKAAKYGSEKSAGDQWTDVFLTAPLQDTPILGDGPTAPLQHRDGPPAALETAPLQGGLSTIEPPEEPPVIPAAPTEPPAAELALLIPALEKQKIPKQPSAYRLQLANARVAREAEKAQKVKEAAIAKEARKAAQADLRKATWAAFDAAYLTRYHTTLTRNERTNSMMVSFVGLLGAEAPEVAAFYVWVNDSFVVRNTHGLSLLLQGAESYRTQWKTGQAMTATRAQQADKTQSNFDSAQQAKAMLRARREQKNAE